MATDRERQPRGVRVTGRPAWRGLVPWVAVGLLALLAAGWGVQGKVLEDDCPH